MAYKILFFLCLIGVMNLKEIGERLKETRESIGISIEEAAEDLKMRPTQIENIESGNMKAFKDVFYLKYFIRDYAKYLGLDGEKLVDEFNEFLFDFTSKIPLEEIEKAKANKKEKKEITSPYTNVKSGNKAIKMIIISAIVVVVLTVIGYFIASGISGNDFQDTNVTYQIRR